MSPNTIIVFGEDWGGHPSSTQHLISHRPSNWRVIWVNSLGLRHPTLSKHDLKRIFTKLVSIFRRTAPTPPSETEQQTNPPDVVLNPIALPWHGWLFIRWLNGYLLAAQLKKALQRTGAKQYYLWSSLPSAVSVWKRLKPIKSLYYCCDDFSGLTGVDHKWVSHLEHELAEQASEIIVTNKALAQRFPQDKTHYLPHGVDFKWFSQSHQTPNDLPASPVAGYYGSVANWLDQSLLAKVALALPNWNFAFVGPVSCDISALEKIPNIHFLGTKPHKQLASYARNWDVSLIPFLDTPQIRGCNPLKLREYLATGNPILSTPFPEADNFSDCIQIATGSASWVSYLKSDPQIAPSANAAEAKQQAVKPFSWDTIAQQAFEIIR